MADIKERKNRRIEARLDPTTEERIARAAQLTGRSRSAFVVDAARQAADSVLARSDLTIMPSEQFDALIAGLDEPDEAPNLARKVQKLRLQGAL